MRPLTTVLALVLSFAAAACTSGHSASPSNSVTQPTPAASVNAVTGTWTGSAADRNASGSSTTVMGMSMQGMSGGMMGNGGMGSGGNMTWMITQTGDAFTGTVAFAGVQCAASMTMSGTFSGNAGTFTITMPANSMPMAGCSGSATGSFTIDPATGEMRGTYSGTSSCMGAFSGQLTLVRK